jgi:hypothetical protein
VTPTRTRKKKVPQSKVVKVEIRSAPRWRKEIEDLTNLDEHALALTLPLLLRLEAQNGHQMFWSHSNACWLCRAQSHCVPEGAEIIDAPELENLQNPTGYFTRFLGPSMRKINLCCQKNVDAETDRGRHSDD